MPAITPAMNAVPIFRQASGGFLLLLHLLRLPLKARLVFTGQPFVVAHEPLQAVA